MINVNIVRNNTGFIRQISVGGHAGFNEYGKDIICAAVSAIAFTAAGALGELAGINNCYRIKDGYMMISVPQNIKGEHKHTAKIILETAAIGLKQIEHEYGDYITVVDEEV